MVKLVVTGHRPQRIPDEHRTREMIAQVLSEVKPSIVFQGMAAGVDLWTAAEAWKLGIPFHSVRPWEGHKPSVSKNVSDWVFRNSAHIDVVVHQEKYPGPWVYESRNRWMIDRADVMLAVWDGEPSGGTFNAVKYARSLGMEVHRIHPLKHTFGF